jgi:hypothetical protein
MLDHPDLRAIPRNLRGSGGQTGDEAEQVQRYLVGAGGNPSATRAFQSAFERRSRIKAAQRAEP